jgi:hypothetical protein
MSCDLKTVILHVGEEKMKKKMKKKRRSQDVYSRDPTINREARIPRATQTAAQLQNFPMEQNSRVIHM